MNTLSIEVIQYIIYEFDLDPLSILNFALSSKTMHFNVLGPIDSPNEHDRNKHKMMAGMEFCIQKGWLPACRLYCRRYGVPFFLSEELAEAAVEQNCHTTLELVLKEYSFIILLKTMKECVKRRHVECFNVLMKYDCIDFSNSVLPQMCVSRNFPHGVNMFMQLGDYDYSCDENKNLLHACINGYHEVVSLLLEVPGVYVGARHRYGIKVSVRSGHIKTVRALEPYFSKDDANFAFCMAAEYGQKDVFEEMMSNDKVEAWCLENYAIREAAANGHHEIVSLLLQMPDVDPCDCSNYALRYARKNGHKQTVDVLLSDPRVNDYDV